MNPPASAPGGHDRVEGDALTAGCSCGWRSTPAQTTEHAELRWRIHVAERRAAEWSTTAAKLAGATEARRAELLELRAAIRRRRSSLREQRERVRRSIAAIRASRELDDACPPAAGVLLDRARELAGMPLTDLWVAYVELGGDLDAPGLAARLSGAEAFTRLDHDIVAHALNEHFGSTGFGNPLDYRLRYVARPTDAVSPRPTPPR